MSIQITMLKVLAGHPGGRATDADVTRSVAILISSGTDWSDRMKRVAARAPDLSIFSSGYVIRDDSGWEITNAGLAFLTSIEVAACESTVIEPEIVHLPLTSDPHLPPNVVRITELAERRREAA